MTTHGTLGAGIIVGCWVAAVYFVACGAPTLIQCRVEAVSLLPLEVIDDPDTLTVGDAKQLAQRLKQCQPQQDGGP